jgi:hypothetical protein
MHQRRQPAAGQGAGMRECVVTVVPGELLHAQAEDGRGQEPTNGVLGPAQGDDEGDGGQQRERHLRKQRNDQGLPKEACATGDIERRVAHGAAYGDCP